MVTTCNTKKRGRAIRHGPFLPELGNEKLSHAIRVQTRQPVKHSLNQRSVTRGPQTSRVPIPPVAQRLKIPQSLHTDSVMTPPQPPKRTPQQSAGGTGSRRPGLPEQSVHGAVIRQRHTPRRQPRRRRKRQNTPPLTTLNNHPLRHQAVKILSTTHARARRAGAVELHRITMAQRHLVPRCQNDGQHHVRGRLRRPKPPRHVTHPPQTEPRSDPPKHPRGQRHPGAASRT